MLPDLDFVSFIHSLVDESDAADRSTLSRIALNALFDADMFPVNIREVLQMQRKHSALAMSFLMWCSFNPIVHQGWSEIAREQLECYLICGGDSP